MRSIKNGFMCMLVLIGIVACTKTEVPVGENFRVPFEGNLTVTNNSDGTFHVSDPVLEAGFAERVDAVSYELRIVRQSGSVGDAFTKTAGELIRKDGNLYYVICCSKLPQMNVTEFEKDEIVRVFQNKLDKIKVNYKELEVSVNY